MQYHSFIRHHILLPTLLLFIQVSVYSQSISAKNEFWDTTTTAIKLKDESRFYVNIHSGYAFALGSTFKFYPDDIRSVSVQQIENGPATKSTTYKAPSRGLGQGFRFGAGLSYIVNDFINAGLDLDYFRSTISKIRDSSFYGIMTGTGPGSENIYKERYTITYDATLLTISPNITFKAISRPRFFIYNKVGLVFTFRPNSAQKETQDASFRAGWQGFYKDSSSLTEKKYEWGIRNPAIGFMGGIGAQLKITEKIRGFTELQFSHVVFVVRERSLTSYKIDGKEMISTLPLIDRELKFQRNLRSDELSSSPDQPMRTIIQRIPITYVGMQVGLAYRF